MHLSCLLFFIATNAHATQKLFQAHKEVKILGNSSANGLAVFTFWTTLILSSTMESRTDHPHFEAKKTS
jgi:hypothetical protein